MSERRIPPAGDPFTSALRGDPHNQENWKMPHGCIGGVVYIGHLVQGDDGEAVEVIEGVPCRRCADSR